MNEHVVVCGQRLVLRPGDFVAAGGQGRVFAQGEVAYKLFDDPTHVVPRAKLDELRALQGPHVAAPQDEIENGQGERIGYTMPFFPGGTSWARACTPAFRRRAGLDEKAALGLVTSLAAALTEIHRHGVTVVDLSENNVLVRGGAVFLIDLDSWQTPGHPATALTSTITCPKATPGRFDAGTDWFAFAVLAATLLLGIHPFKGKHPVVKGLAARMQAGLSVFDAAVRVPAICESPEALPPPWRGWLRAVLQDGERTPPPLGSLPTPGRTRRVVQDTTPARTFPEPVRSVLVTEHETFVATETSAFDGRGAWHDGHPIRALGLVGHQPYVLLETPEGELRLRVRGCADVPAVSLKIDDVVAMDGRVFARSAARILELDVRVLGSRPVLLAREVTRTLPLATQLFPGVAMQNVLGSWHASLLGYPRGAPQCALPELGSADVIDARFCRERLVVLAHDHDTPIRHRWRLGPHGDPIEHHSSADAIRSSAVFASVAGMYVHVGHDGLSWTDDAGRSRGCGPMPTRGGMDLHSDGRRLLASSGCALWQLPARAPPDPVLGFDAMRCR